MMQLPTLNKIDETYVCFGITNSITGLSEVIISKFDSMLGQISRAENEGDNYLTVYFYSTDLLALGNKAMEQCKTLNRADLADGILKQIKNIENNRKSIVRKVKCVQTGQIYQSAFRCAQSEGINYSQLHKHLNRMSGYRTVGGQSYEWV